MADVKLLNCGKESTKHDGHHEGPTTVSRLEDLIEAAEVILAGMVIAAGGSGKPALADGTTSGNAIGVATRATKSTLGPRGRNAITYVLAGPVQLPTSTWDVVTDSSGGLVQGMAYYLSQTTPGHLTIVPPANGQSVYVGTAVEVDILNVQFAGNLTVGAPSPPPGSAIVAFSAGLEITTGGGASMIIPYCPANGFLNINGFPRLEDNFIGFGATVESSPTDAICWASPIVGTLTTLRVNVSRIVDASVDFSIRQSLDCNGPFNSVMAINGVTAAGCYEFTGEIELSPGDRISFLASMTKLA